MTKYSKGDYTNCRYDICEILRDDEVYCIVGTGYADKIIKVLEENEQLKEEIKDLNDVLARYEERELKE